MGLSLALGLPAPCDAPAQAAALRHAAEALLSELQLFHTPEYIHFVMERSQSGNGWLDARDERGSRRLDDPNDFVRIEIESALRLGKRVIPVLVHEARMPRPDELPEAIRPLATRNAVRLTHERFRADVQGLIKALQGALAESATLRPSTIIAPDHGIKPLKHSQLPRAMLVTLCVLGVVLAGSVGIWFAYPWLTLQSRETAPGQPALVQPPSAQPAPAGPGDDHRAHPARRAALTCRHERKHHAGDPRDRTG